MTWYAIFEAGTTPSTSDPISTGEVIDSVHLTEQGRTWISLSGPPAGQQWSRTSQTFVAPPTLPTLLSKLVFVQRFTAQEFVGLRASADANVLYFMYLLDNAVSIRPSDTLVQNALQYCASLGLLVVARAAVIGAE